MVSSGSGFKLDVLFEFIILGNQYNVAETVNKDGEKTLSLSMVCSICFITVALMYPHFPLHDWNNL